MKISVWVRFGLAAILAASISGCSGLQKTQALLDAEALYESTRQNEDVLRYANTELDRAGQALEAAAQAEAEKEMNSLAYVAKVRTETAVALAERKAASEQLAALSKTRDQILYSLAP